MKNVFLTVLWISCSLTASANDITRGSTTIPDDRSDEETVLQPQYTSYKDMRISRSIRRILIQDKNLSESARNIDIISSAGHVTLIGPVQSKKEMNEILTRVRKIDGISTLTSELTVPQNNERTPE